MFYKLMSINNLVNGSTLQNELIQLLSKQYGDEENNVSNTNIKVDADNVKNILTKNKSKQKSLSKSNKVDLNNVIEKTMIKHDSDELRTVNPDLSGGANILGLVENILAGGSLNDTVKNDVTNNNSQIELPIAKKTLMIVMRIAMETVMIVMIKITRIKISIVMNHLETINISKLYEK